MRHSETNLQAEIVAKAYISPGAGELAWRREDLSAASHAIAAARYTILGGEVWWVPDRARGWTGIIPSKANPTPAVWHWETGPRSESETWDDYCARTLQESLEDAGNLEVEADAADDVRPNLWFNITFAPCRDA